MIRCVRVVFVFLMVAAVLFDLAAAVDTKVDENAGIEEPFLIRVRAEDDERRIERFQRILVISLPFCAAYSYGLCYLSAAAEQKDKTPDLYQPRDYKPFMLGGAVGLSLVIAIYDCWWRQGGEQRELEQEVVSGERGVGVSGRREERRNVALLKISLASVSF